MSERTTPNKRQRLNEPVSGSGTGITGSPRRSPNRASYLSPTRASLARYNPSLLPKSPIKNIPVLQPTSGNAPLPNGQNALEYVLGRTTELPHVESAQQRSSQELENGSIAKQLDQRLSSSATPGKRLQRVVDKVIEDVEQTRTPEVLKRFLGPVLTDEDEDELPETPSGARYSPPKGILSSGSRRRKRRSPEPIIEVESLPVRERILPAELNPSPVEESVEIKAKREEIAALKAQLEELQTDCWDLERIFNSVDEFDKHGETPFTIETDGILHLLNLGKKSASTKPAPPTISQQLTAFLPFSLPVFQPTSATELTKIDTSIPSCAPLPYDNINDLVAHIRRFTPLAITSSVHTFTTLRLASSDRRDEAKLHDPVTQQHDITLRGPENEFTAKITFRIDTPVASADDSPSTPTISHVAVPLHDLSDWARPELGSWVKERAEELDIATLGYGIDAYYKLAMKRAKCWAACADAFQTLCSSGVAEDAGYEAYVGRQCFDFSDGDVLLRVWWKANFDETGAAESNIYVDAVFLKAFKTEDSDYGAAMAAIGSFFDSLLKAGHDVFDAIQRTVRLTF